jgi:formyltetrahydrofolate-dependent phosphoribosylglycinamide formyltransferase
MNPRRIGVLASGGGSNLGALLALLDARAADGGSERPVVACVLSNTPGAGALTRAADRGIPTAVLADQADGAALLALLTQHDIGTVALAGYLRMVPAEVTRRFAGRMVNVHPSLLPAFGGHGMYGRRVHAAVLAAGATVSGCTAHFVDEVYDRGPVLAQWPVPVAPDDTPESLAARVLRAEHALFPRVVAALAEERLGLGPDGRVFGRPSLDDAAAFVLGHTSDLARAAAARIP